MNANCASYPKASLGLAARCRQSSQVKCPMPEPHLVQSMALISRVVHSDPDILGGTPVFVGTRVPMRTLLDYLEAGDSLEVFLDHFPSVSREQAISALELAKEMLTAYANPA